MALAGLSPRLEDVDRPVGLVVERDWEQASPTPDVGDIEEATALVNALGREGVFTELVDAVSSVYEVLEKTVIKEFERSLHCTRAWADEPSVSNVLFQARFAGGPDGLRSGRLHADDLWY